MLRDLSNGLHAYPHIGATSLEPKDIKWGIMDLEGQIWIKMTLENKYKVMKHQDYSPKDFDVC